MATTNVMMVGVGGQGSLLASKIMGNMLVNSGFDVKVSEVHGMAQRGGSVVTYIRYGDKVFSPVVDQGSADVILAFELLEAMRWSPWLKKEGKMIVNTQNIKPMPVLTGAAKYPEEILDKIRTRGISLKDIDALSLAEKAGMVKAVNVVLLGVLSKNLDISVDKWIDAMREIVNPRFVEANIRAFELGRAY